MRALIKTMQQSMLEAMGPNNSDLRNGHLYLIWTLDVRSVIDQRADFGHIELDILLSLLEAVRGGLRIENRNLSEIRL